MQMKSYLIMSILLLGVVYSEIILVKGGYQSAREPLSIQFNGVDVTLIEYPDYTTSTYLIVQGKIINLNGSLQVSIVYNNQQDKYVFNYQDDYKKWQNIDLLTTDIVQLPTNGVYKQITKLNIDYTREYYNFEYNRVIQNEQGYVNCILKNNDLNCECELGLVSDINGQCVQCHSNYFFSLQSLSCVQSSIENCLQSEQYKNKCLECIDGYVLDQETGECDDQSIKFSIVYINIYGTWFLAFVATLIAYHAKLKHVYLQLMDKVGQNKDVENKQSKYTDENGGGANMGQQQNNQQRRYLSREVSPQQSVIVPN